MAISNRAQDGYCKRVQKDENQIEEFSVKENHYYQHALLFLFTYIVIATISISIWSCSWTVKQEDNYTIAAIGVKDVIEIDMPINAFARKGIPFTKMASPFQKPDVAFYSVDQLAVEFETFNNVIIRIWFYAEPNRLFKLFMPKKNTKQYLSDISADDIIQNFGKVNKYENQYPPKASQGAVWMKHHSFGIAINTIDYPNIPFHFGLNWDDTLSYIAVSK